MACCGWRRAEKTPPEDDGAQEVEPTVLAQHLARAEADLVAAAGGGSLCRAGDGPGASSIKYAEGRHAALRELRHLLRSSDTHERTAAVELLDTWEAAQDRADAQGPTWIAYRAGGVAELRSLIEDLTSAAPDLAH